MTDRFDLEQQILSCWNVVDDINLLYETVLERSTPLTQDEMANVLLGMKELYQLKFEKLFSIFEHMVYDRQFKGKTDGIYEDS